MGFQIVDQDIKETLLNPKMAESTKKESNPITSFGDAVVLLTKTCREVHNVTSASSVDYSKVTPYKTICIDRVLALYAKMEDPADSFIAPFRHFYETCKDELEYVLIDGGVIYDEWLKAKEEIPGPWEKKKTSKDVKGKRRARKGDDSSSWSSSNVCKGLVIYYDYEGEKGSDLATVSIPLSEFYLAACAHYQTATKKGVKSHLPATILYAFYCSMYHVADEEMKEIIMSNITALKVIVDALTPEKSETEGSGMDGLKKIMSMFAKSTGMGGGELGDSELSNALASIFDPKSSEKISQVVKKVAEKMQPMAEKLKTGNLKEMASGLQEGLSSALDDESVTDLFADVAAHVSNHANNSSSLAATIPTAESVGTPVATGSGVVAADSGSTALPPAAGGAGSEGGFSALLDDARTAWNAARSQE
jgi:hypothetical protein